MVGGKPGSLVPSYSLVPLPDVHILSWKIEFLSLLNDTKAQTELMLSGLMICSQDLPTPGRFELPRGFAHRSFSAGSIEAAVRLHP